MGENILSPYSFIHIRVKTLKSIMSNTVQQIIEAFETWQTEDEKFVNGNSSAGTRARKSLQEISKLIKTRRFEITEEKNARKEAKA